MTCCWSHRDNVPIVVVHHDWQESSRGLGSHLNQEAKCRGQEGGKEHGFLRHTQHRLSALFTRWPKLSLKLWAAQHLRFPEPQGYLLSDQWCSWQPALQRLQQLAINRKWFSHLSFAAFKVSGVSRNAGRVSAPAHTINHLSIYGFSSLLPQTSTAEALPPCQPHDTSDRGLLCVLQMRLSLASSHQQEAIPVSQHTVCLGAPVL